MEGLEPRGTKPKKPSDSGIVSFAPREREVGIWEVSRGQSLSSARIMSESETLFRTFPCHDLSGGRIGREV